ncbi:MAG: hypothetical protein ABWY54_06105 [Glaciihabitans sp.]
MTSSTYTPAELSYLLAGRDNAEAVRARSILGLEEFTEGDPRILPAVQSLSSKGLVTAIDDDVAISETAQALGYLIGNANDWTRIALLADGRVEALVVLSAPGVDGGLILRADRMGNYEAVATLPGVHPTQVTGSIISGYLSQWAEVTVSLHRDLDERATALVMEHVASGDFVITKRTGLAGPDVTDDPVVVTEAEYLADLEAILADGESA